MQIFESPASVPISALENSLFLAGGITGCHDWQSELLRRLEASEIMILNPRRTDYNALDPNSLREQIAWEHRYLRASSAISFWFPSETLCPITLFELGAWSHWRDENGRAKPLFVGVHPDYARRENLEIQLGLERSDIRIVSRLDDLAAQISNYFAVKIKK